MDMLEFSAKLAEEVVHGAYKAKSAKSKLTGEWIIFAKHASKNFYLAIAEHSSTVEEDRAIYNLIEEHCKPQYPFLFEEKRPTDN